MAYSLRPACTHHLEIASPAPTLQGEGKNQPKHHLLILITLVTVFLTFFFLNPFSVEATSSPFALAVEEAFAGKVAIESHLLITTDPALDHGWFDEIADLLNKIDIGQSTLSLINQYDISVQFTSERGSRFNPNTNQIFINRGHDPVMAALILVHEVTHARYLHEGSAADVTTDSRDNYVAKKVHEEAMAVANSIEAKMELEAVGVNTYDQQTTLETPYQQAYEIAITTASAGNADLDDDTARTIGRNAARQMIFDVLMNGKAVTSSTRQTYPFYWGADWDKHNGVS